jgi:ubiquinone/menaquinone biosynthesis C-methylase UbiE
MSTSIETFQISADQAEIYESTFVPALFAQWAPLLLDAAGVAPGQSVLDAGCGTGILARIAADRVGPTGRVVGVDLSEGMLAVARRLRPDLEWRRGDAADLPLLSASFDLVACQSMLMFVPDATRVLAEMGRVAGPQGTVAVQVYASLADQPSYGPWVELAARHVGPSATNLLGTYWVNGDLPELRERFATAGLEITGLETVRGTARFGSVEQIVRTEVEATPLIDRIDDRSYRRIIDESAELFAPYVTGAGVDLPIDAHLVVARGR